MCGLVNICAEVVRAGEIFLLSILYRQPSDLQKVKVGALQGTERIIDDGEADRN